ncbi:MAG: hypothetical protein K2K31_01790, partial [Clostridia bacterium]|nr:hypothetical protein [Clostridia bacterium]
MEFIDFTGNKVAVVGCPGCNYKSIPGLVFENDVCYVSQDWELPICGMLVVAPRRHVEYFEELTEQERKVIFDVVNKVISLLRKDKVAKEFNVIFEEKKGRHFHIWILPRDGWKEIGIDPTKDIRLLQVYAKENLRT